jgi:hypothetical protein
MENNELMNWEETEIMDDVVVEDEKSGIGTCAAMLIGAGLTLAVGAGVKLVKKGIAAYKAKKELRKPDKTVVVDDKDIEEIAAK